MPNTSSTEVKSPELKAIRQAPKGGKGTAERAKGEVLKMLAKGYKVAEAMTLVGRSPKTYENWRKDDAKFAEEASRIIGRHKRGQERESVEVPDFPEFCEKYLGRKLFRHQLQWFDVLEGREPRELTKAQTFEPARKSHLIINTPPHHAKSTTITVMYTVWRILKNPNTRVILISKKQQMAADFLFEIKDILTSPSFEKLHNDFAPSEGFELSSPIWTATRIYFGPELRDESMKDPTVQAIGMGGQLYGTRADLIILDDCIEPDNAHEVDKQLNWLSRVVLTRPGKNGTVLVVGTRIASVDLYGELRNPKNTAAKKAWTYFAQPAVEEFADDPEDWVTLWPRSNRPQDGDEDEEPGEDGLYPMWDGPTLAEKRDIVSQTDETAWLQGYQQQEVAENAVFPRDSVYGCVDGMRQVGRLTPGMPGVRDCPLGGMSGMRVIGGLDPASEGHTAATVVAFDPQTQLRWILNVHDQANMTPAQQKNLMIGWTREYGISEWKVEKVLMSSHLTQDPGLVKEMAAMGCIITPHQTTPGTKWDPDTGIMSLTTLFTGWQDHANLIRIPSPRSEAVQALCTQLVTYKPKTRGLTDCLMSLWFVEVRIRELIQSTSDNMFRSSPFATTSDRAYQTVVDLNDIHPDEDFNWSPFHQRRAS